MSDNMEHIMNICVVLVTYNRIDLLKEALNCYNKQTFLPKYIIVVDNGSIDGTKEYLEEWFHEKASFEKIILYTGSNLGGAGGFSVGIKRALITDADFIFLADDDAFAEPKALEYLDKFYSSYSDKDSIGAITTSVINCGEYAKGHRRVIRKGLFSIKEESVSAKLYNEDYFEIDQLSFVGAMIKKTVIQEIGTPIAEYFFQYDDIEYSERIRIKGYTIICVPQSRMHHNTGIDNIKFSWKNYYAARNRLNYAKKYFCKPNYLYYIIVYYIKNCSMIARVLKKRTDAEIRMFKIAAKDAKIDNLGLNSIYKPGVDIEKL
ncbi:MAG: glycosyltransferase [Lachnospiraceae bacterium]|nr:glycosyltransferase [Lachnospiraceae bacterium]